ncbi:uncharacterized protein N7487_004732 [Penicillium crustosum]|uniref:uncharacterized protein n=1 Tax=Penicillium crustosum TaxID=36656 RepID=UPI0023A61F4C|nr:uncharacterized protein N7487_004732 [Penicillium crustosum]KAJ5410373.1 hypothetical protein N7487_004732 [Penicillium crustosum]
MSSSTSTDMSTWEKAYHNAWRHFHTRILDVLERLAWQSSSPENRQETIEQLGRLPIEVDRIRTTGQEMFEHVPGCQTVRDHHLTYFANEFMRDCHKLDFKLDMLLWRLMNSPSSDRKVYNNLLMLLHTIQDRVPN